LKIVKYHENPKSPPPFPSLFAVYSALKKQINRKCSLFIRLCKSKRVLQNIEGFPRYHDFRETKNFHQNFWHFILRCRLTYICLSRPFCIISLLPFFLPINFLMYRYASRVACSTSTVAYCQVQPNRCNAACQPSQRDIHCGFCFRRYAVFYGCRKVCQTDNLNLRL
jgi:hypothetical protein